MTSGLGRLVFKRSMAIVAATPILALSLFSAATLADGVTAAAALTKMEQADLGRVQACRMFKISGDGIVGKVNNTSYATQCFSAGSLLYSCFNMANQAATWLDLERTGQTSFAELTNKLESESGTSAEQMEALSLAESAPTNVSADQLGRNIYKQCSSYVNIH